MLYNKYAWHQHKITCLIVSMIDAYIRACYSLNPQLIKTMYITIAHGCLDRVLERVFKCETYMHIMLC